MEASTKERRPTINDFRRLGAILSPSERVSIGEVGDVLSAVIAVVSHGNPLLDAAELGPQAVADFYHDAITDQARADGVEEKDLPRKGQPVHSAPQTGQPVPHGIDPGSAQSIMRAIGQLADAVKTLQERAEGRPSDADVAAAAAPESLEEARAHAQAQAQAETALAAREKAISDREDELQRNAQADAEAALEAREKAVAERENAAAALRDPAGADQGGEAAS